MFAATAYEYAATLVRRDGAGDRERAASLAEEALAVATELGVRPTVDGLITLRLELQGVTPLDDSGDDTVPAGEPGVTLKAPVPDDTLPRGEAE